MAKYTIQVLQLSGTLLGEVELPETAQVEEILVALKKEEDNTPRSAKVFVWQGRSIDKKEYLHQLGLPAPPAVVQILQVNHSQRLERVSSVPADARSLHVGLFGPHRAGKTSLMYRYTQNTFSERAMLNTIGIDFQVLRAVANEIPLKIMVWDQPAGKERFRSVTSVYFRRKEALLLVIDLTNPWSFRDIADWMRFDEAQAIPTKLLIGNKSDLTEERHISREDAEEFAREHDLVYFETSAKEGTGVEEAMDYAIFDVLAKEMKPQPAASGPPASIRRCQLQ